MKTSHHINVMLLGLFVAILTFPHLSFADPMVNPFSDKQIKLHESRKQQQIEEECKDIEDMAKPMCMGALRNSFLRGLTECNEACQKRNKEIKALEQEERRKARQEKRERRAREKKEKKRVNDLFNEFE